MPRVQEGCCIASPRTVLLFCSDILLDLKCEPQSFNRKMKPVQLCSNPSAVMVSPRQHIVSLGLLPNNITACLKTTKNYYSWKPAILHCMGADNSSLRPPTFYFITIVPFCRRNIPLAVSICSISSTRPLAVGKSIPTLCCLMRFFKYPPSSSACLDLCVCSCVWKSVVPSCFCCWSWLGCNTRSLLLRSLQFLRANWNASSCRPIPSWSLLGMPRRWKMTTPRAL